MVLNFSFINFGGFTGGAEPSCTRWIIVQQHLDILQLPEDTYACNTLTPFLYHLVPEVEFVESLPFFDLSGIPDMSELPRTQDANSERIFVPNGMIFGDQVITQVFVSLYLYALILWRTKQSAPH